MHFKIHGMDCAEEIAILNRMLTPLGFFDSTKM